MPRRIAASQTGAATASPGGVAISGVHCGDIYVQPQTPCRSLYRDSVVTQIAPTSLQGRGTELDELRHFCTVPDGEPYVWWQASAWSGKTAMLSWFVLNPPPGVRIVSFFITARLKGHADRSAFLEFVLAQLSEILDEPMPMFTDASGEVEFRDRLARTARFCAELGERLVLVVDGLDEDRGVMAGPDAYSVAALLPQDLPDGVRVIVAGRPNPPIPADVPAAHPLRRASVVRALATSPHATAIQTDMRLEIRRLLLGSDLERDLLGLVTAAGGGLSGPDLAELTHTPVFIVEEHLRTVTGRSFAKRPADWRPDAHPEVYLLGHEEIQVEAVNRLGEAVLREHRKRLHEWADSYRTRGWPAETPEYLLRGYGRLLHEVGALSRMLAITTDQTRYDRLFAISGGDFAALSEIGAVQEMLQTGAPGDLASLGRVAVHRIRITKRAESIRVNLPHVWARLGQPERAETLARSMPDPDRRAWALAGVARAVAANGQTEKAARITDAVTVPRWRSYALTGMARALAVSGEVDRARQLALQAEETAEGVEAMAGLMEVYALCGDKERARHMFLSCKRDDQDAWALAGPLATAGDVAGAQEIAASIDQPRWRTYALVGIAHALARSGDRIRAQEFAAQARDQAAMLEGSGQHGFAMAPLVTVLFATGEQEQSARLADRIEEIITAGEPTFYRAYAWAELAKAVAATGDLDRASEYAERAEQATVAEIGMDRELAALVQPLRAIGEPELARRAAQQITEPYVRAWALTAVVDTAADTALAQAKAAAMSIAEPGFRLNALGAVADVALRVGDVPTARALIDESVEVSRAQGDEFYAVSGLASAIGLAGQLGESGRARELANRAEKEASSITHPSVRAAAMAPVLAALSVCGEVDLAWEMAQRLERFAVEVDDRLDADVARAHLAVALAPASRAHATEVARRIENPVAMMTGPDVIAVVLTGDFDRAEQTARAIDDGFAWIFLAQLADAAAANGDPRRALRLAREAAQGKDIDLMHDAALVILIGAMVRLGERGKAADLAARIRSLHKRVWAVAEFAQDPAERRAAVASALRVTDWSPVWQPVLSPLDSRPPELQKDLVLVPARILAAAAPEALKTVAEELLLITENEMRR
ncbi:hypothetical protein [Micromonospora sp. NBC_00860]|uniref:hypothetical protein n=1 Tax=Micromonospora sp. NBC_00860 TaxID=2975980 RepID=UPI00386B7FE9|nr:hypothetical protein OH804_04435 [Micromonospora sp. NBC_00860]